MYETHYPGFCYLKDGKYRKKVMSNIHTKNVDPAENSEKIKALLFTDNELDIHKVLCLHLLGTHVQNRKHIQRRDGKLCSFAKSQIHGNKRFSLQAVSQRNNMHEKEMNSVYDKLLPRYVLEVRVIDRNFSASSINTFEVESCCDDEPGKRRKLQVPIYINSDIRAIISSVLEALEVVNSPKLNQLLRLARDPDELRNMLSQEDILEFMIELAGNQLVSRATAYDFTITHAVFDKGPGTAAVETVAQVLEINADMGLRNILYYIRKMISRRYEELVLCNVLPGRKKRTEGSRGSILWNFSKTSFLSGEQSTKTSSSEDECHSQPEMYNEINSEKNSHFSLLRGVRSKRKVGSQSLRSIFPHRIVPDQNRSFPTLEEIRHDENSTSFMAGADSKTGAESRIQQLGRYQDGDVTKYDLKNLSNSQRILLGLKVASMKCRPVNMHQFENKRKADIGSLITSIIWPILSDSTHENFAEDDIYGLEQKRLRRPISQISKCQVQGLGNLTRGLLSNFRYDIATIENKRRVQAFMNKEV